MHKSTNKPVIIGASLASAAVGSYLISKKMCRKKTHAKIRKNWKKAIMWSAFSGMINGVVKMFIKEGQQKLAVKKAK